MKFEKIGVLVREIKSNGDCPDCEEEGSLDYLLMGNSLDLFN